MPLNSELERVALGEISLKGKEEKVLLYTIKNSREKMHVKVVGI
jgi:hypothetical protein